MRAEISAELAAFFESGVSVLVGTRDARLLPECLRAVGARVEPGGTEITVFVPKATSALTVANLQDNDRVAVCFERASDHLPIIARVELACTYEELAGILVKPSAEAARKAAQAALVRLAAEMKHER